MSISREELQDAARRAFGGLGLETDPEHSWRLIVDMGWLAMTVPERLGGLGLGAEAAALIHSELGRALVPGPVIGQMLAIGAMSAATPVSGLDQLLAAALDGQLFAAALGAGPDPDMAVAVVDADRAGQLLMTGPTMVALVDMTGPGIAVKARPGWDESRRLFDVRAAPDARRLVLAEGDAAARLTAAFSVQRLLALSADSVGGASALLERTIAYLVTRRQFGRPLAMFQTLKHRCADLAVRIEAAEALLRRCSLNAGLDPVAAGALKAHCARLYADTAEEATQLHGGIGLTMEHDCHRFLKRALLNQALGGSAGALEEAAGRRVLAEAG